jgi:uncharacterized caspase-like protein
MFGKPSLSRTHARVFTFVFLTLTLTAPLPASARQQMQEPTAKSLTQPKDGPKVVDLPDKAKRYAVVIGIDKYTSDTNIPTLHGAANDARAIADALVEHAGFEKDKVILLTSNEASASRQPTRANIGKVLSGLKNLVEEGGMLVVAFSGHGVERMSDHQVFLLPSDAYSDPDQFDWSAIPVNQVTALIKQTKANQVMLLLDSCRNDPSGGKGSEDNKLTRDSIDAWSVKNSSVKAFVTLYAASEGQRAWEYQDKSQGYFSWAFVQGLKGEARDRATGEVTLGKLIEYVQSEVPRRAKMFSGKEQKPHVVMDGYGSNLVISKVEPAPRPLPPLPPAPAQPTTGTLSVVSEPGAQITVEPLSGDRTQVKQGAIPQSGEPLYTSAPLPFGKYLVTATRDGYVTKTEEKELVPGKLTPVVLPLKEATYKVTVRTNIPGGRVELGPKGAPPATYPIKGGQVVAENLRRGEYTLNIIPDEVGFESRTESVTISRDLELERKFERNLRTQILNADFSMPNQWQLPAGWKAASDRVEMSGAGLMLLREDDKRFADFEMNANVELVGGKAVSFIVRAVDEQNYYRVRLFGPNADRRNVLRFYVVKDGKERRTETFNLPTTELPDRFIFNLKAVGGSFEFRIDDNVSGLVLVGSVDDITFAAGTMGVAAEPGDKARIFQYIVYPINPKN